MTVGNNFLEVLRARKDSSETSHDLNQEISLGSLSELTGFPISMIKDELLLCPKMNEEDKLSLEDLRKVVAHYLVNSMPLD